ncbi:MAG: GMC family oxidoreductase, partial [Gemmobacter sp.]
MEAWDHIVVGGGSAGALIANRLSARGRVLLLEAGGRDDYIWVKIPIGYLYCIGNPRTDWMLSTRAEPGLGGRALRYPRGRILGGCSSINGMLYLRGQAADYDHWRQLGCTGWGWEDVLPLFMRHEDDARGADAHHGAGGEWRVEGQRLRWEILDAFARAATEAGIPATDDFNRGDNAGVGYFRVNQRAGWRWNSARAFLHPLRGRERLRVVTGAEVARVLFEEGRAVGVEYRHQGRMTTARAAGEVILAAGAIGSPKILQLSGIGPARHLAALGIAVRRDAPVGENLQDHLQLRCAFRVRGATTLNTLSASLWGKARIALEYALRRTGPMSMSPS